MKKKKIDPVDIFVGKRVRLGRLLLDMSQEALGENIGVTFQQVQKYENGSNRIGSSRLYAISKVLGVKIEWFFRGCDIYEPEEDKFMSMPETIQFLRCYYKLSKKHQKTFNVFIQAMSKNTKKETVH